jgi:hypothetical protein
MSSIFMRGLAAVTLLATAGASAYSPRVGEAAFPGPRGLIAVHRSPEPEVLSSAIWVFDGKPALDVS